MKTKRAKKQEPRRMSESVMEEAEKFFARPKCSVCAVEKNKTVHLKTAMRYYECPECGSRFPR